MTETKKISTKIQIAILAFFIVFMPLGSWYYLQSGFNYHKNLMSELKDYGKIPGFSFFTQNNDTFSDADLHGKIAIANFYTENQASTSVALDYARRILGQFKSQEDLIFLFHNLNPKMQNDSLLKAFATKENLLDKRAFFLSGKEDQLTKLFTSTYKIPMLQKRSEDGLIAFKESTVLPEEYPYFVLIDSTLTIRNYYDINDKSSMNRLVEHLAIILPREKKSKAELIPQKEK